MATAIARTSNDTSDAGYQMSDGGGFTILEVEWTPLTHDELRLRRSGGVRRNTARTRHTFKAQHITLGSVRSKLKMINVPIHVISL